MYTPNTPYEAQVEVLKKSLDKFGYDYKIYPIENTGKWIDNCKQNARIILKALQEYKDDVLYLDADAEVLKPLTIFKGLDCDIACHVIDYETRLQLCSGTTWVGKNSTHLIEQWIELNNSNDEIDDDNLLTVVRNSHADMLELPEQYCSININRIQTGKNPIIKHWQKSKEFRND